MAKKNPIGRNGTTNHPKVIASDEGVTTNRYWLIGYFSDAHQQTVQESGTGGCKFCKNEYEYILHNEQAATIKQAICSFTDTRKGQETIGNALVNVAIADGKLDKIEEKKAGKEIQSVVAGVYDYKIGRNNNMRCWYTISTLVAEFQKNILILQRKIITKE